MYKTILAFLGSLLLAGSTLAQVTTPSGGGISSPVLINQTTDVFNRTAGNLGANWTSYLNDFSVTPGTVTGTSATNVNLTGYTGVATVPTQVSRVTIRTLSASSGAAVRISGTIGTNVNFYACIENSTQLALIRVLGASNGAVGTQTTLAGPQTITGVAGDSITLSVVGNTLSCYRNNATNPLLQSVDATVTTGLPGIYSSANSTLFSSFALTNPTLPAGALENIVFDGDSIIAANGNGSNGTDPATSFLYLPTTPAYVTNLGVSGKCVGIGCAAASSGTIESMLSTGTSIVDTLFVPGVKNICVLFGGTNDIAQARTPAQTYTDITTYITARHAAGWKVIVVPPVSRESITIPARDSNEAILGSLINANAGGADAVVVLPASVTLVGASSNTTLFNADAIHPTEITHIDIFARAFIAALSKF